MCYTSFMAEITTSLDWTKVRNDLEASIFCMKQYSNDVFKMVDAISSMVSELSKEEINCRRHQKQTQKHKELVAKINEEIAHLEQYITFGVLLSG